MAKAKMGHQKVAQSFNKRKCECGNDLHVAFLPKNGRGKLRSFWVCDGCGYTLRLKGNT